MKKLQNMAGGLALAACLLIGDSPASLIIAGGLLAGALALQEISIRRRKRK